MPISVTGTTDTNGAISVQTGTTKIACVVARKGTGVPSMETNKVFSVTGTADAGIKWGEGSKAVQLVSALINNGVTLIKGILVQEVDITYTTLDDTYALAFAKLLAEDIDVIVLDDVASIILTELKAHLDTAEEEDKFRYAVVGSDGDDTALIALAASMNHKRIFVVGPTVTNISGVVLSNIYSSAGLAALICTETADPALPMNSVEMKGFGSVSRITLKSEKTALVNGGVVPLYTSASGYPTIYRLVTSYTEDALSQPDPVWQEGTTVFIADDVLRSVQTRIKQNYKRTKNVARILDAIRTDVVSVLQTKNDLEIIQDFDPKTVSVLKDPTDSFGALIDYDFKVVTPLYNITISQHMKL